MDFNEFENRMEKTVDLHSNSIGSRWTFGIAYLGEYGFVYGDKSTSISTTELAFPCGLDYSLCVDGVCFVSCCYNKKK